VNEEPQIWRDSARIKDETPKNNFQDFKKSEIIYTKQTNKISK
jgi:hypothetical protein